MSEIKNIVFDFGGVLLDWNPRYLYRNVFTDEQEMEHFLANICTPAWNLRQDSGFPLSQAMEELVAEHPEYSREISMFYGDWAQMLGGEIIDNTRQIKALKSKYKIFGLTNWSAETFPIAHQRYSFFKDFEGIVVSGQEKLIKPDEAIYQLLLSRYNLRADECLFIDDSLHNIKTAQKLGFATIHLADGINLHEQLINLGLL
ncbi:MAG: HAD family phosphatase [Bacteroidales bacterium]|nr:HAD family phosphatase [Bacteroidales bacterium]